MLVALAVLVGAWLRVLGAQGDLWLDEIWSLDLVGTVHSPGAVVWGISHDNNHILNSLWLYALGPDRPSWCYRMPAVALGTLSIALAARIGWRQSRAAGVASACLAAAAQPLVVYGSEARGYAGLIAATLVAIEAFERALQGPPGSRWRQPSAWVLGLAVGLGTLSHLTMLATPAVLGLTAVMRFRGQGRPLKASVDAALDLFGPSLLGLVPAMAAVLAGIVNRGGFTFGDEVPFAAASLGAGFGGTLRSMLGLPDAAPRPAVFLAAGIVLAAFLGVARGDPTRRWLAVAALVILPGAMAAVRLPNLEFPRYFLVPGLVLMLAEAELIGRCWAGGTAAGRIGAALLLGATLAGQAAADLSFLDTGRGHYTDALAIMAGEGRTTYATDSRFRAETVVNHVAARRGLAFTDVPQDGFCAEAPDWYLDVTSDGPDGPPAVTLGPQDCRLRFDRRASFPASTLSGMRWTLYRRAG